MACLCQLVPLAPNKWAVFALLSLETPSDSFPGAMGKHLAGIIKNNNQNIAAETSRKGWAC